MQIGIHGFHWPSSHRQRPQLHTDNHRPPRIRYPDHTDFTSLTARELAILFFDHWYCENGLPNDIISDRDKLFMSAFWKHLTIITGIKHKALYSYHPQSNGSSERT